MPVRSYWTLKRFADQFRIRRYRETTRYEEDNEVAVSYVKEEEGVYTSSELLQIMVNNSIEEFQTEDECEFAKQLVEQYGD